jgi:hypothetical protein
MLLCTTYANISIAHRAFFYRVSNGSSQYRTCTSTSQQVPTISRKEYLQQYHIKNEGRKARENLDNKQERRVAAGMKEATREGIGTATGQRNSQDPDLNLKLKIQQYNKMYHQKNKEQRKLRNKTYYTENKEICKMYYKMYHRKNWEERQVYFREYHEKNRDIKKEYYLRNSERMKLNVRLRLGMPLPSHQLPPFLSLFLPSGPLVPLSFFPLTFRSHASPTLIPEFLPFLSAAFPLAFLTLCSPNLP